MILYFSSDNIFSMLSSFISWELTSVHLYTTRTWNSKNKFLLRFNRQMNLSQVKKINVFRFIFIPNNLECYQTRATHSISDRFVDFNLISILASFEFFFSFHEKTLENLKRRTLLSVYNEFEHKLCSDKFKLFNYYFFSLFLSIVHLMHVSV